MVSKAAIRLAALALSGASAIFASNFSFTGAFTADDQVQLFTFSVAAPTAVTVETLSYGGGSNAVGLAIAPGGFDPRFTWFASDGTQLGADNGGHCGLTNLFLGACNDAYAEFPAGSLPAGSYFLALTQDGNDSNGDLPTGFAETGNPNFTATGACSRFCDSLSGAQLDGHWAVDILGADSATATALPEPVTFGLAGAVLVAIGLARRRRR